MVNEGRGEGERSAHLSAWPFPTILHVLVFNNNVVYECCTTSLYLQGTKERRTDGVGDVRKAAIRNSEKGKKPEEWEGRNIFM